jgi:hypothetical protein
MVEVTHCPQAQLHIERCACPAHWHQDPGRSAKDENRNGNDHGHRHASTECAVPGQCKSFHQLHTMMISAMTDRGKNVSNPAPIPSLTLWDTTSGGSSLGEGLGRPEATAVRHASTEDGKGGNERFKDLSRGTRVDRNHGSHRRPRRRTNGAPNQKCSLRLRCD